MFYFSGTGFRDIFWESEFCHIGEYLDGPYLHQLRHNSNPRGGSLYRSSPAITFLQKIKSFPLM